MNLAFIGMAAALGLSASGSAFGAGFAGQAAVGAVSYTHLGGMGLKYDDYLAFRDTLEKGGAMSHTVMFIHTASDPTDVYKRQGRG